MATLPLLGETDNALRHATIRRLSEFATSWEALATALQQNDPSIATLDRVAPALSSVCDEASWQVCGIAWMQKAKNINWMSLWDPEAHRVHNDFKLGEGRTKLTALRTLQNFTTSDPSTSTGR